jgi:hypothetical protein
MTVHPHAGGELGMLGSKNLAIIGSDPEIWDIYSQEPKD